MYNHIVGWSFFALQAACAVAIAIKFRRTLTGKLGAVGFGLMALNGLAWRLVSLSGEVRQWLEYVRWLSLASLAGLGLVLAAILTARRQESTRTAASSEAPGRRGLLCPKCDHDNLVGAMQCHECGASLRPTLLGVLTTVTIFGLCLFMISLVIGLTQANKPDVGPILGLGYAVLGLVVFFSLRYGRYWAWVAVQILWALGIVGNIVVLAIASKPQHTGTESHIAQVAVAYLLVQVLVVGLFWIYLYSERVRAFCSVGKG